jgi:murein DD-endopeptidase MepM/ murein hydrolase activator NlpD
VCGLPIAAVISTGGDAHACTAATAAPGDSAPPVVVRTGNVNPVGRWNTTQVGNAAIIVNVGHDRAIPPRGWVIAVATAMTESRLINTPVVTDHDSVGLFQQRPSQGWGTPAQLIDPIYASTRFYTALLTVPDWQRLPVTQAAQAVQRSAFPQRYAAVEHDAETVVAAVAGVGSISDLPGASPVGCAGPPQLAASGWTSPVKGTIGDPFGIRRGRLHTGVDLIAPRYTIIRAASGGVVVRVVCEPATGNCDVDGSDAAQGCGWYVDIQHADGVATRYCHMVRRPDVTAGQTVTAGQPIGAVGTSGHSTGTHLHFEVHTNVNCNRSRCPIGPDTAQDPVLFLREKGVEPGAG